MTAKKPPATPAPASAGPTPPPGRRLAGDLLEAAQGNPMGWKASTVLHNPNNMRGDVHVVVQGSRTTANLRAWAGQPPPEARVRAVLLGHALAVVAPALAGAPEADELAAHFRRMQAALAAAEGARGAVRDAEKARAAVEALDRAIDGLAVAASPPADRPDAAKTIADLRQTRDHLARTRAAVLAARADAEEALAAREGVDLLADAAGDALVRLGHAAAAAAERVRANEALAKTLRGRVNVLEGQVRDQVRRLASDAVGALAGQVQAERERLIGEVLAGLQVWLDRLAVLEAAVEMTFGGGAGLVEAVVGRLGNVAGPQSGHAPAGDSAGAEEEGGEEFEEATA